jgi:glycosyltransferase involved in cell wall biosynthesis
MFLGLNNQTVMEKDDKSEKDDVPIRVLHLIDRITGYGTTRLLWNIVRLTPSKEIKHFVVTFSPDKGKWVYADRLREEGVYRQVSKPLFLKLGRRPTIWFLTRYIWTLWHVLQSLIWFRPHIIHVHTGYALTIALLLKVVLRRPVVHLVPSLFSQMIDQGKGWVPRFYARFHSLIDCFFTGVTSRDELLSIGVPGSKVLLVRGVIDFQEISTVRHERQQHHKAVREILHLSPDALIALSVGRLDPSKGHIFALEALPALVREFPKLHWLVVGDGKLRGELEDRAKALGIFHHVHLLGHQDDPLPYYAAATVYLRTMIFEERNLSCFEAMAMGLPMAGFDTGCEPDLINTVGHGILVPNQSAEALSAAVSQILMLPDQGREMGSRGIKCIRENYDLRNAIQDVTAVYEVLKKGNQIRSEQFEPLGHEGLNK